MSDALCAGSFAPPVAQFEQPKRGPGRPTTYSLEVAIVVCDRLGDGAKLHEVCADPALPSTATIYRWIADHPEFHRAYQCALLAKFDKRSEELEAIAADGSADHEQSTGDDGLPVVRENKESLGRSKLRIDTLKWIMAKELPHKYAEAQPITLTLPPTQPVTPPPTAIGHAREPQKATTIEEAIALYRRQQEELTHR